MFFGLFVGCFEMSTFFNFGKDSFGIFVFSVFFNFGRVVITKVSEWSRAELKPNVSSEANNVYSFGLKLNIRSATTVPPTFEVDNLSVVYRTKNVK